MSNPLAAFRKYQKILLVIFGVALMIVFTVGTLVSQFINRDTGGTRSNEVVVTFKDGAIRESEMEVLRYQRQVLKRFLDETTRTAFVRQIGQLDQLAFYTKEMIKNGIVPPDNSDNSLVQTYLLSSAAKKMGMSIDKKEVLDFLWTYSDETIGSDEFQGLLKRLTDGAMSANQFLSSLGDHLLAYRYQFLMGQGFQEATPMSNWDYYQRLSRPVEIEAVRFPVADYLSDVPEPSDTEIATLYNEAKDRFASKYVSEPGFRRRKRIAAEYIKADIQPFIDAELKNITDEEVKKHYEENIEEYRKLSFPSTDEKELDDLLNESEDDKSEDRSQVDSPETETQTADSKIDDNSKSDASTETSEADATQDAPTGSLENSDNADENNSEGNLDSGDTEGSDPPESASDDIQDDNDEADAAPEDECGFQEESEPSTDTDAKPDAKPSQSSEAVEVAASDVPADSADSVNDNDGASEAQESSNRAEPPAQEVTTDGAGVKESEQANEAKESDLDDLSNEKIMEEPEYTPLEEVAEDIRQKLALLRVSDKYAEDISAAYQKMRSYYGTYINWEDTPEEERKETGQENQPTPPNLQAIANEFGFAYHAVPLVNVFEFVEEDPETETRKYELSIASRTANGQNFTSVQTLFDDDLSKYEAQRLPGESGTEFLFWKTGGEKEYVPTLEDCREEVVAAIKKQKAVQIARNRAQAEADRLKATGEKLGDAYPDDVIEPGSFTWFTPGVPPDNYPRLSTLKGIKYAENIRNVAAADKFMEPIFALTQGEFGVALDVPENNVYLVYLKNDVLEEKALRELFAKSGGLNNDVRALRMQYERERMQTWWSEFSESYEIDWKRDPQLNSMQL